MEAILREAFGGESIDNTTRVSESAAGPPALRRARRRRAPHPRRGRGGAGARVVEATRTWDEDLVEALARAHGEEARPGRWRLLRRGVPRGVQGGLRRRDGGRGPPPHRGARRRPTRLALHLYDDPGADGPASGVQALPPRPPLSLTRVLPISPTSASRSPTSGRTRCTARDGRDAAIFDFGLRADGRPGPATQAATDVRERFQDAFRAVWDGRAESDGFNALVLGAGLTWRQVVILRAVAKYLRQTGSTFSQDYVESALVANTGIARSLVELFEARFDPDAFAGDVAGHDERAARQKRSSRVKEALDDVASLDHDRIVRALLGVIQASLRTNFYQPDERGHDKAYVSLKLDPKKVPDLPAPRPMFEIWVYSPRVEGVHLRFGKVARGGLRWSRPARGLPHRGPRARQGPDGQERRHRADRQQGRLLRQAAARPGRRPRGLDGRGHRVPTSSSSPGCSTSPTTSCPARPSPPHRVVRHDERRHLPRRRGRQGHGEVLRHRQRRLGRLRLLARRRLRVRRLGRLRPQGAWASPPAAPGSRSSGTSASSASTPRRRSSPSSASAT